MDPDESIRVTTIHKSALLPYSVEEMYALVNDIRAYPRFLPWCRSTAVLDDDPDHMRASIELAKGPVNKTFTTINRLQKNKMIEMRLENGPFKHLQGFWRFDHLGEQACKVSLDMEFEFSSKVLSLAIGPVFSQICNSLVDAFHDRAKEVYGVR